MTEHIRLTDDERREVLWAIARALDPEDSAWKAEKNTAAWMVLKSAQRKIEAARA
jgi:hypothetical protein